MDNKMAVFNNREFGSIRVIEENGNYLFCGFDVAKALGYAKPRNAINTHCKGALKRGALTEGGVQELTFIPEGDVYRLIVHSRLPGAERFEKWVFDEVLPMIRKTGGYMTASLLEQAAEKPEILLAFADQLLAEHEKNRQLSGEVERLRPKADFYDAFVHEENQYPSHGERTANRGACVLPFPDGRGISVPLPGRIPSALCQALQ